MIYEIVYDNQYGVWRIRLTNVVFWFFSSSHYLQELTSTGTLCLMGFATYGHAMEHAAERGIPKAYKLRNRMQEYITIVNAEGCHGTAESK